MYVSHVYHRLGNEGRISLVVSDEPVPPVLGNDPPDQNKPQHAKAQRMIRKEKKTRHVFFQAAKKHIGVDKKKRDTGKKRVDPGVPAHLKVGGLGVE